MIDRPIISFLNSMGDSLSDTGDLYNQDLFHVIPMRWLSGLNGITPHGSFTNGYVWEEDVSVGLANQFTISELRKEKHLDYADISDAVITGDYKVAPHIQKLYSLNNYKEIKYRGRHFVRTYDEGGLTAYDYSGWPSTSMTRFFSRLILSTLDKKRKELINDDKKYKITQEEKDKTLTVELSGANDLITVNKRPSKAEADRAVKARIHNVKELIKHGYKQFVLINLPDLSLTPRFQNGSKEERDNAHECSEYFNAQLKLACRELQASNPNCTIEMFDLNSEFTKIYNHPERYHFDRSKRDTPYINSPDFKMNPNGTSPAKGEIFWDEVHPTADVHALLAYIFLRRYEHKFHFVSPVPAKEKFDFDNHRSSHFAKLFHPKGSTRQYDGKEEVKKESLSANRKIR